MLLFLQYVCIHLMIKILIYSLWNVNTMWRNESFCLHTMCASKRIRNESFCLHTMCASKRVRISCMWHYIQYTLFILPIPLYANSRTLFEAYTYFIPSAFLENIQDFFSGFNEFMLLTLHKWFFNKQIFNNIGSI